jgi:murein DD-endopeptidase MepM/ murein hydrolase activator NlpD
MTVPMPFGLPRPVALLRRRRSAPLLVALLAGFGAAAFAVAPLALTAPMPAQRLVVMDVPVQPESETLAAWNETALSLHRHELTRAGDTVASLLRRLGADDAAAAAALAADDSLAQALRAHRNAVAAQLDGRGALLQLQVLRPAGSEAPAGTAVRLVASPSPQGWAVRQDTVPLAVQTRTAAIELRGTWRAAVADAALPAPIASQLLALCAQGGAGDCTLAPGAKVAVLYETLWADGLPVPWNDGVGRVLAARFIDGSSAHQAAWFVDANGRGGYVDSRGRGREAQVLARPVEHTQVTSGFATRLDPFRRQPTEHRGVDYSAPIGTPVHSVAPGVVEFAGRQSGYGNVVEVRHSTERTTLYAHLSRIDVAANDRVERGQLLGAVGATGWATGPHLHFEYRVGGVHQDPQLAAAATGAPVQVDAKARARFDAAWRAAGAQLDVAMSLAVPRSSFE